MLLAGQDLAANALQAENEPIARCARLLTWHHARLLEDPEAARLAGPVAEMLPREALDAGLGDEDVEALEQQLAAEVAQVARRLEEAGIDPLGPLESPTPQDPPAGDSDPPAGDSEAP